MKKMLALALAVLSVLCLFPAAPADAATGRVKLISDFYIVVQTDPSYLERYTAGRMISFPSSDLYAGDPVSGIESTWGHQTWIIDGQEIDVDVDKWDVPAEEAMEYFSKHSR